MKTLDIGGGFVRVRGTEAEVCNDIAKRQQLGIAKYGTTVRENQLTELQWHQHLYEELLDAAIYQKRIIEIKKAQQDDGR